jgi:hypothetical protein
MMALKATRKDRPVENISDMIRVVAKLNSPFISIDSVSASQSFTDYYNNFAFATKSITFTINYREFFK